MARRRAKGREERDPRADREERAPKCLHPRGALVTENVRLEWILLRCEACGKILATKETE